jgi:fumarate reductase flavoprotein subunit
MDQIPPNTDAVIVGSGAAGLAAAVTLAEAGAGVIVFEKQRSLGGTSNFFHGTFAVESELQRPQYIMYSRDEAFQNVMEYGHWRANPRLVRAIINESGATIGWLQDQGVVFSQVTINMPGSPRTYHVVKGKGEALVKALVVRAKERRVEMRTSTPVTRILKQGGRISGVVVDNAGEPVQVACRAVVVASGGYANNKEWLKKYTGYELDVNIVPVGNTDKMGDGIRMAWEVGAAEEGVDTLELYRVAPLAPEFAMGCGIEMAAAQPDLWIDARGRRFCDETITFYDTSVGNASARLGDNGYSFSLTDTSIIRQIMGRGIDKALGVDNLPGTRPANLEKEFQAALEMGSREVFAADSVEALAGKIGVDPAVLRATVDEYNGYCEKGHDDLFAKNPRYLRPLQGPVFYAVRGRTVFLGTMGGIKINEKIEVLDKNDEVIPGLYAAGIDAGGMYGDSYPIRCSSGLTSSFALNSGRIAGRSALEYLGIQPKPAG